MPLVSKTLLMLSNADSQERCACICMYVPCLCAEAQAQLEYVSISCRSRHIFVRNSMVMHTTPAAVQGPGMVHMMELFIVFLALDVKISRGGSRHACCSAPGSQPWNDSVV